MYKRQIYGRGALDSRVFGGFCPPWTAASKRLSQSPGRHGIGTSWLQLVAVVPGAVWYATGYLHSLYTAAEQSSALRGPEVALARLIFAANGSALSRTASIRRGIGRSQLMAASCPGDWGWLVCHWLPCAPAARRPRGLLPAPQRPYLRPSELPGYTPRRRPGHLTLPGYLRMRLGLSWLA